MFKTWRDIYSQLKASMFLEARARSVKFSRGVWAALLMEERRGHSITVLIKNRKGEKTFGIDSQQVDLVFKS